jgi:hypothetical protein
MWDVKGDVLVLRVIYKSCLCIQHGPRPPNRSTVATTAATSARTIKPRASPWESHKYQTQQHRDRPAHSEGDTIERRAEHESNPKERINIAERLHALLNGCQDSVDTVQGDLRRLVERIRLGALAEQEMWFSLCEIEDGLCKDGVRPREPRSCSNSQPACAENADRKGDLLV